MSVDSLSTSGRRRLSQTQVFGIEGYKIPLKTQLYVTREYRIPKAKLKSVFTANENQMKEPGPTSYAATAEKVNKEYWTSPSGQFRKAKRSTSTEEAMKYSKGKPGPGTYHETEKGRPSPRVTAPLGFFSKSETPDFLSNVQCLSEQSPGVGEYFKNDEDRARAYRLVLDRPRVYKYTAPKAEPKPKNTLLGPGYLKDLEKAYAKEVTTKSTPKYRFAKARPTSALAQQAAVTKFVPGVGHYKEVEKGYKNQSNSRKDRVAYISKYKHRRFSEAVAHEKRWVPGPGAYDILPAPRTKSN